MTSGLSGTILITGGTGTLGRAIARTARAQQWPCSITIYSRSELRQALMRQQHPECRYVLGDVRDADRLVAAVAGHDLVVHAAAMKRIPECEMHPMECYRTNIQGSRNVLWACQAAGVRRLIGISSDKACKAITAYGASKLAMERLFQAQGDAPTACTVVRYGNVVASNGSVIPLWREQATRGEALTVTNPSMTRFWMAPSAAVDLVVRAARHSAGDILVPRMGALSIADLAAIIAPGRPLVTVGLRSIEKQHEDLVHADERARDDGPMGYTLGSLGATGHAYTSDTAPRLSPAQFLTMLDEAESYE